MIVAKSKLARTLQIGLAATVVATGSVALFSAPAQAAAVTLSPATGTASTAVITAVTGTGFMNAAKVAQVSADVTNYGVVFSGAACATARPSAETATLFKAGKISVSSATRLIVTTPATLTLGTASAPKAWNLCVYKTGGPANTLIGNATYTVYAAPTLDATTPIAPAVGGVAGGETVTVTGTGFTSKTTAKLGGIALTGITVATGGLTFTAVVPAGVAGAADLIVTTEGGATGTTALPVDGDDAYTYQNSIVVDPPSGWDGVTVTIRGAGFVANFAAANTDAGVVFAPSGATYAAADVIATVAATDITVVSDNEIVFDVPTAIATTAKTGAYNLRVAEDTGDDAGGGFLTAVSSGSTFTVAQF
jgi:hypothetical protein